MSDESWRSDYERDSDIILYSSAFRRLRGVTQVIPITGGVSRTHDRLTHSLKVAQVGKRSAQFLKTTFPGVAELIEPDAVYAAGLAHDLGHPPFGHVGENELQRLLADPGYRWQLEDSFEGNAQTFRIITRLSKKRNEPDDGGMGLSTVSLAACVKYPWVFRGAKQVLGKSRYKEKKDYYNKKWGFYLDDVSAYERVVETGYYQNTIYSPNAVLMDIADDITYAIHDVHDYFRMHQIPLHEIGAGLKEQDSKPSDEYKMFSRYAWGALSTRPGLGYTPELENQALEWLSKISYPTARYGDTEADRRTLHNFESGAVQKVQEELAMHQGLPVIPAHVKIALEYLKELTWYYVINHPHLSASQEGQRRIINQLHRSLCSWTHDAQSNTGKGEAMKNARDIRRLPGRLQSLIQDSRPLGGVTKPDDKRISRAVVDFIVSLTDAEAVSLYRQLVGATSSIDSVNWL